jgi:hypothetical protein
MQIQKINCIKKQTCFVKKNEKPNGTNERSDEDQKT